MRNRLNRGKVFGRFICFLLGILILAQSGAVEVRASEYWPEAPETASPNVVVMEASTGTILYEKSSLEQHYPASITKIMTTLVALENSDLDEIVTFSDASIDETEGSGIARDYGEQMAMEQCLYAVMLASANECAYAVAEHVGGTVENFVAMMNEKAKELGCQNTHFTNPHGLHDENHYTCCYDMALIAQAAYQNETFRIIVGTARYTIPPTNKHEEQTDLQNHNEMLYPFQTNRYVYDGCTGGKTGYTQAANSTLVTYAERDGLTLICVVMNTQSPNQWLDSISLFDYCFDNFQILNISENETKYTSADKNKSGTLNNNEPFVDIDKDACIVLPKTAEFSDASSELTYDDVTNDTVGTISYQYAGHEVGKADIVKTGVKIEEYRFDNQTVEQEVENTETAETVSTIRIKPVTIIIVIAVIVILGVIALFAKKFADNYYIIRHNMEVRRNRKNQFRKIKRRKGRRRRRR